MGRIRRHNGVFLMKTLFSSKKTKIIEVEGKEMIERVPASAILAFDEIGNVIMVRQNRGSFGTILEVPAGKVDKGEDPLKTARRELEEETGYTSKQIIPLISYYPSVGYTTEQINCYVALDIRKLGDQRLDDGEKIDVVKLSFHSVVDMIKSGEIKDSKTIMCIFAWREKMAP